MLLCICLVRRTPYFDVWMPFGGGWVPLFFSAGPWAESVWF